MPLQAIWVNINFRHYVQPDYDMILKLVKRERVRGGWGLEGAAEN